MWTGTKTEHYWCPDEFQHRLTAIGGLNRYGEPKIRLAWSQTELIRAGAEWTPPGQPSFRGYRDIPLGLEPCWMLMQWQPPEKYGSPEYYYLQNYDFDSNLQTLGEYPYYGRYEIILPLSWKGIINGKLVVEHMHLNSLLVDLIEPIIKEAQELTFARYMQIMREQKEREDKAAVDRIADNLQDAFPAFNGAEMRSSSHLACNSVVQQKMEAIEKHWRQAASFLRAHGKGLSQTKL